VKETELDVDHFFVVVNVEGIPFKDKPAKGPDKDKI